VDKSNRTTPVVLVADDEPSMLALVSRHVKNLGYEVLEASEGESAWNQATHKLPDLVVLDVMMPGMSGWEVCRRIREHVGLAHTGVIMLTGIGQSLNELTSPLYGADAYIDKPFEFKELDGKIRSVLSARGHNVLEQPAFEQGIDEDDSDDGLAGDDAVGASAQAAEAGEVDEDFEDDSVEEEHPEEPGSDAQAEVASRDYRAEARALASRAFPHDDEEDAFFSAVTLRPPPPPPAPAAQRGTIENAADNHSLEEEYEMDNELPKTEETVAKKPARKPAKKAAKKPAKKAPAKKAAKKPAKKAAKKPAKKAAKKVAKKPAKKAPAKKAAKKPAKKVAKKPVAKKPAKKVAKKPAKKVAKKPAKKAAKK